MEYQQASPATTFSKKLIHGGGLTGKHEYDGVFGGPVKPGCRMEDYREIFGGSTTCSIPILDFPELKERNISMEARSLKPDYSMIFGGCEEADFAVPFEEMFSKKPGRVESLTPEARVPTESRCRSATGPKHSNSSEEKRAPLPEVSSLSFDDAKQFNLSFSRSNAGSKNGMIGTTHIAQLHAVPGYTCLIDEQATQQVSDGGKAAQTTLKDARVNANSSEEIKERKASTKAVSGPQQQESIKITSSSNSEIPKKPRRHWSFANDISFDAFEMGLGTQPSRMSPSNIGSGIGSSIRSSKLKFGFISDDIEGAAGGYSPPLLDEEIDANSAVAASAAAVRKAIEEAQKKISLAKELMERNKLGLQNHVKPSFANGLKANRRDMKTLEQINRSREAQEMHLKDNSKQVFNSSAEQDTEKSSQAALNFSSLKETSFVKASIAESNSARVNYGLKTESRNSGEGFWMPAVGKGRDTALDINQEVSDEKTRLSASAIECNEKITEGDDIKKPMDGDRRLEVFEDKLKQEKLQRKINSVEVAFQWDIYRHNTESGEELSRLEENAVITRVINNNAEAACESGITHLQEEYESRRLFEPEEDAEFVIQELEENIIRKETKDVVDQVGNEMRQREADYREEVEILSTEVPGEKNKSRLAEIPRCEGNGRGQKEEFDRTDYEIRQQVYEIRQEVECLHQEENDQIQIGDPKPEVTGEYFRVHTEEVIGASRDNFQDEENSQKSRAENSGTESDGNLVNSTESENLLQEDYDMNEISKQNFYEDVESETILTAIHLWDHGQEVKSEGAEVTEEDAVVENERMIEQSYPKEETVRGSEVAEEADDGVEQDQVQTGDTEQGLFGLDRSENRTADVYLGETDLMFDHQQIKYHVTEYERACKRGFPFEEVMSQSEENVKDVSDSEIGFRGQGNESNFCTHVGDRLFSNGIDSDTSCNSEKQDEEAVSGFGETDQDAEESQVPFKNDEDETYFESSSEEELANNSIDIQSGQQPPIFESEEKIMSISPEEKEENKVQVSLEGRTNQNMDKDEKYHETQTTENRDTEDNLQKEVELGNKQHARKEEMRMRELKKEKEKERMAVERAIREVRERAFAEARERAERAAAKRTAAEARERSEKVFPETKSKSEVEKASVEAELRAQRAAVERATAEARERALEKALSEKASFKMRNQADKSATEYSGASRDYGIKPNDQQSNFSGSSKSSATDSELAERCKATFERNQRTAERAAKALAEKNMRDLLAKKEQAERNRLAEILDAEVKRWSSGKERNLRALLSTLQYILGSDSGWQPVPLTDLISTAAVKKAYRKATLFVHPDKLQQRGASIQQKYTCEKVFDLLKDAWNKFSTEER